MNIYICLNRGSIIDLLSKLKLDGFLSILDVL